MTDTHRQITFERAEQGVYTARNVRGGELRVAADGSEAFTPVELLLTAIGACSAMDVDAVTARRAQPTEFTAHVAAQKTRDDVGNLLRDIELTFTIRFPEGTAGDEARAALPRALQASHDRTCTVSRTVEAGTPVAVRLD